MTRYGMTIPLDGVPLADQRDWIRELADLGYTLIYWTEPGEVQAGAVETLPVTARPGFFSRAELVQAYGRASGRNVDAIDFYQVLALYKLAVISEGIYKRFKLGKTLGKGFDNMGRAAEPMARRALRIADESPNRALRGRPG